MISINKIYPMHIDNFDEYKKYTKALGVKDYYWVSTDSENDLWMPTTREIDKINNPQMLMSYTDGELCEGSVEEIADVIPVIDIFILNDIKAEEYFSTLGNTIEFAGITWTVCHNKTLIANSSIGKTKYNTKEKGFAYSGSIIEQYLANWLDQYKNKKIQY